MQMKKLHQCCALIWAAGSLSLLADNAELDHRLLGCANPDFPVINTQFDPQELRADQMNVTSLGAIELSNNVFIPIVNGRVKATNAQYQSQGQEISAIQNGDIAYLDNYFKFKSGSLTKNSKQLNLQSGQAFIKRRNLIIGYDLVSGVLDESIVFTNTSITTCVNPGDGWEIEAGSISIDEISQQGVIRDLSLSIKGQTVLQLPYLPFPTTTNRLSGFLEPDIGLTSEGIDLYVPYFLVLSERSDITLAPRHMEDRGSGLEINFRYLSRNDNKNFLDLIFLPQDKKFHSRYPAINDKRWAFKLNDSRSFQNISLDTSWGKSSDALVPLDLSSNLVNIARQRDHYLPQSVRFQIEFNNLIINLSREGYQPLTPIGGAGYIKKPELQFYYTTSLGSTAYFADVQYTDFGLNRSTFLARTDKDVHLGKRLISEIGLTHLQQKGVFNISMQGTLISKKYNLDGQRAGIPSVDIGRFEASVSSMLIDPSKYKSSVLIPTIIYHKTSYKDQNMHPIFDLNPKNGGQTNANGRSMFYGKDRIIDQEFILSSLEWESRSNFAKRVMIRVANKHELQTSKVLSSMLNNNAIKDNIFGLSMQIDTQAINLFLESDYSNKDNALSSGRAGFTARSHATQLTASRSFRRDSFLLIENNALDYAELLIEHSLPKGFSLVGGLSKDIQSTKILESYFGIGYENCCLAFRIFASDQRLSKFNLNNSAALLNGPFELENILSIENKSKINFEFELKGLTGSRSRINKFLSSSFVNL